MSLFARSLGKEKFKGTPADLLVVGLGNPGPEYVGTRHNVGADVAVQLAERSGVSLKNSKYRSLLAALRVHDKRVVVAFPLTYMNNSGEAVRRLVTTFGISKPENILIVHDELDLDVGRVRLKVGGGLAGHNGLKSVKQHLNTAGFMRLRIGIDRPSHSQSVSDYVLRKPPKSDREALALAVEKSVVVIEHVLEEGIDSAMALFNRRD